MKELNGIMYCEVHDDVAIEGYDWSDVCHDFYTGNETFPCKLIPLFANEDEHIEADPVPAHGMPRPVNAKFKADCMTCDRPIGDGDYASGHRSCALCRMGGSRE